MQRMALTCAYSREDCASVLVQLRQRKWPNDQQSVLLFEPRPNQLCPEDLPASRILRGRVSNIEGIPISGALIEPVAAKTKSQEWVTSLDEWSAVTDDSGKFELVQGDESICVNIQVTA